ncbi:HesB/YadR/YfhF family protein [Alkalicoccus halolimnae]|uniref:HesB/YadR/YfhF family protein n=1 Tax=Alkalicoccus halolimnae TaxID=1667239 RepID=A0A5C7F5V3_9BACI|nr:HesB/YadR/YfhF family protein [Alkalicoccus halolimnae]TXF86081.1 hypothetical protein FTX54_05535 [Alkalicoccus halolimnae]
MKLHITEEAVKWFQNEVEVDEGDTIKFFAKYGGSSPIQSGFSIGFEPNESPITTGVSTEIKGITFYVEEADLWYFDGNDLTVAYDDDSGEIVFEYDNPNEEKQKEKKKEKKKK